MVASRRTERASKNRKRPYSQPAVLFILGGLVASCRHAPKQNANPIPSVAHSTGQVTSSVPSGPTRAIDAGTVDTAVTTAVKVSEAVAETGASSPSACNEQPPQEFLVGAHFNGRPLVTVQALREWKDAVAHSIRYRTEQYGYFKGFGSPSLNDKPLHKQIHATKFFGLTVQLHERVIPALKCVEQAIARECAAFPYQPMALAGIRDHNTYLDGDVTNHAYGIAIDIDPLRNPCCGCIKPWNESARCKGKKTEFERMDMPACWVPVFERFGFYWLGHDALRDTMHFEFLGDPGKIAKAQGT